MGKQLIGSSGMGYQEGTNRLTGNRERAHWKGTKGSEVGDRMSWARAG